MIRAAIYARFSSDLQNEKSVDDQLALCRELCAREGMTIVGLYDDRAISGRSANNRPGLQQLIRAAETRAFDVIVTEDLDRMFRDQGDYHTFRKRLDFHGITIHTASGKISKIDGALRAMMSELYIENLALHTRRGLESVVRSGRHAGGRAYGYKPIEHRPGELEIIPEQADIVRRIFADYIAGKSARRIAGALNAANVPPPRGLRWNASTINGNTQRGGGILLNDLYVGRIVWNKVHMVKDPATGKRISRPNPKDQYRFAEAPHLRIIDQATWDKAQARKIERRGTTTIRARTMHMLTGLVRCGSCGGGLASVGERKGAVRMQCSTYRESGACSNGRRIKRDDVDRAVLETLQAELIKPAYLAEYVKTYNEERMRLAKHASNIRAQMERRLGEIGRELERAVNAIVKAGVDPATLASAMKALEAERAEITATIEAGRRETKIVSLHPAALARYRRDVERLARLLPYDANGDADDLIETLRRLIDSVIVHAAPHSTALEIEIKGRLSELLDMPVFPSRSRGGSIVVAREGLEPPTPGL